MPNAATRAYVLGSAILKEQDKLVYLLTAERGILKAIAPGALKNRNRFGASLELFTEADFQYHWKEDREMITLVKGEIVTSYFNIVANGTNIFYFYFMSEILQRFSAYDQKDPRIYRLVRTILDNCNRGLDIHFLTLYFLIWILRIEGMMFNPGVCSNCLERSLTQGWLRLDFRGILCTACRSNENIRLNTDDLQFIRWTEKHPPAELMVWKERIDTGKLSRIFKEKLEHHGEFRLKTTQYLTEFR